MSSISLDNIPQQFRSYFSEKYKVEDLVKPSKLLKFYLHCIQSQGEESPPQTVFLETLRNQLLSLRTSKGLTDYHFLKLVCACPELAPTRTGDFVEAFGGFEREFGGAYDNGQMNKRATKVSQWLKEQVSLRGLFDASHPLEKKLTSSDRVEVSVDRLEWASAISSYRPFLFGRFMQSDRLRSSAQTLQFFQSFMEDPQFLDTLSDEDFWDLHREAHAVGFRKLFEVTSTHSQRINVDNFLEIFVFSLRTHNGELIRRCIAFFNQQHEGGQLEWNEEKGLKVVIDVFTPELQSILEAFASDIRRLQLNTDDAFHSIVKQNIQFFTRVTTLQFKFAQSAFFDRLPHLFPKVKRFGTAYLNFSQKKAPFAWKGVEVLEIYHGMDQKDIPPSIDFLRTGFPDLKVCIGNHFNDFFREEGRPTQRGDINLYFAFAGELLFVNPAFKERCTHLTFRPRSLLHRVERDISLDTLVHIMEEGLFAYNSPTRRPDGNSNFQRLDLSARSCTTLTENLDGKIEAIVKRCQRITSVDVEEVRSLSKLGVQAIVTNLRHLTYLVLGKCPLITDQTFEFSCEPNRNVVTIYLNHTQVTSKVFVLLKKLFPCLRVLELGHCPNIDDKALEEIANLFPDLETLNMGNTSVTDAGLYTISRKCKGIKMLDLRDTQVTARVKNYFPEGVSILM